MIDANQIIESGHLMAFVVDADRDLIRFACRFCGATTEPMKVGQPIPEPFTGLPHVPECLVIAPMRGGQVAA